MQGVERMRVKQYSDRKHNSRNQRINRQVAKLIEEIVPPPFYAPVDFCEKYFDLAADKTSNATGKIKIREKTPYLVDPVNYFASKGKCRLTIQAVEQTAKSTSWKLGAFYRLQFMPSPAGIIYQNEDVGKKIIRDSFLPLLRCNDAFASAVPERANENPKTIDLPGAPTYLMSGEQAIISIPLGLVIGDEINKWRQEKSNRKNQKRISADDDYQVSKLRDMDKRTRTFENSLRVLVCSPEGRKSPISVEYENSSKGFFFLPCLQCKKMVFDTTKPEEFLFYSAESGVVDKGSIQLICPECGHVHKEETDKVILSQSGVYIHEHPERLGFHAGFCWGALASQFPGVDWLEICSAIERAKLSNSYEDQAYLCNSIKGLPFSPTVITGEKISIVRSHFAAEVPESLEFSAVYLGVDTQEVGYWFAVMAIDTSGNWYTLDYGFAWDDEAVISAWNREVYGVKPQAAIIDEGGHRKPDVDALVSRMGAGVYKYKGEGSQKKEKFRISEDDPFLILAAARKYNAKFLYLVYSQHRKDNSYWYVLPEIKKTFVQQIAAMQPPPTDPEADFEDWTALERQHDLFDAHKMIFVLHDFACRHFSKDFFANSIVPEDRRFNVPEVRYVVEQPKKLF